MLNYRKYQEMFDKSSILKINKAVINARHKFINYANHAKEYQKLARSNIENIKTEIKELHEVFLNNSNS